MNEKMVKVGFGVMLLKGGKILLGKRHSDPKKADSELHGEGTWTLPGGKLHFGESLEDGCYREVLEETGIKINRKELKLISVSNDRVHDAHFVTLGFLCREFKGQAKIMEPDEIMAWQWFALTDLPFPIYFPSAKMIKRFIIGQIYNYEK